MYIAPNSTIYILKACPCDPDFGHTLDFESIEAQTAYFSSLMKYQFTAQTYQRYGKNSLKIATKADNLYDCNYLMFQNTSYGSKWFYAFVTGVEYINNETSQVDYFIDPLQTYAFDYWLRQCFVEREHVAKDTLGAHTVAENIATGEQVTTSIDYVPDNSRSKIGDYILYLYSESPTGEAAGGKYITGFPCAIGARTEQVLVPGVLTSPGDFLKEYINNGRQDSIAAAYIVPSYMSEFFGGELDSEIIESESEIDKPTKIGDYVPHNNKLLCYPYSYLRVANNSGENIEYKFEDFSTEKVKLKIYASAVPQPAIICIPESYKGVNENMNESIVLSNFAQMPWVGDVYKAWLAQNKATLSFNMESAEINRNSAIMSSIVQAGLGAGSMAAGDVAGASGVLQGAAGIAGALVSYQLAQKQMIATMQDKDAVPNTVRGLTSASGINVALNIDGFTAYTIQPKQEYAIMIDHYFDMYGYQVNELKTPQHNSRTEWNYVKTSGCLVSGKIPADDAKLVQKIFDNGITFWHNPAHIGNYTYTNSIKG